ncbi:MAG: glutamate--tRNA ligase [Candidatus Micrarchaeales archaeon]|nr:glutamate--tRNA ligase [Candidatus Micrarchaeales archaeon]
MAVSKEVRDLIRKFAIKNAVDYGKADLGSVLGKVISQAKGIPVPELKKETEAVIKEVNKMKKQDLEKEYKPFEKEFEERARETAEKTAKPKMEIEGAVAGKVFTRYPPEPGGYMTIGNAKQCILSDELAKMYNGQIFLYFDDTNPEKSRQEYVDGIKRDTAWLGVKFGREYYASDYVEKEYDAGRKLIQQGNAYVCLCSSEQIKSDRFEKKECKHRKQEPAENLKLFESMLKGAYDEGQALVRLKGDMSSENATLRDPAIFRIKKAEHYRQGKKYIVWPTYHINTPIVDNMNGVTDVIRGKEYEIFDESYKLVLKFLGMKPPRLHYQAMLQIKGGLTAHKRELRKLMKEGALKSWDDPRLLTVMAMRRRGIQPEAIRSFIMRFGFSRTESIVPLDMLLAENKKLIDPIAKHLFFVSEPVKVKVEGVGQFDAKLKLHPAEKSGFREYKTGNVFYISGQDAAEIHKTEINVRLKDLMDIRFRITDGTTFLAEKAEENPKGKIIQWVPESDKLECTVLVPGPIFDEKGDFDPNSMKIISGYVEGYAKNLKEHDIVQFERFGYCILDDKKKMQFIFISK